MVGAVWRFDMVGSGPDGEQLVTSLHYVEGIEGGGDVTAGNVLAVADAIETVLLPTYLDCITTGYTFDHSRLIVQTLYPTQLQADTFANQGTPGANADTAGPIERSGLIRKLSGLAGRSGHGRAFVPMPPRAWYLNNGLLDVTGDGGVTLSAFGTQLLQVIATGAGQFFAPALFNRQNSTAKRIVDFAISTLVGMQRRRRIGIGA